MNNAKQAAWNIEQGKPLTRKQAKALKQRNAEPRTGVSSYEGGVRPRNYYERLRQRFPERLLSVYELEEGKTYLMGGSAFSPDLPKQFAAVVTRLYDDGSADIKNVYDKRINPIDGIYLEQTLAQLCVDEGTQFVQEL
jgi:hypothetical protein